MNLSTATLTTILLLAIPKSLTSTFQETFGCCSGSNNTLSNTSVEYILKRHLLANYDYTSLPVHSNQDVVLAQVGMSLFHILDTNEREQTISAVVSLRFNWVDEFLMWDNKTYPVKKIWIPARSIWHPDLVITNYASEQYGDYMNTNAVITDKGEVLWMLPVVIKAYCNLDVRFFPFDVQQCNLTVISWTYTGLQLDIEPHPRKNQIYYSWVNQEWAVSSIDVERQVKYYACCVEPFPQVTFTLNLRRRCLFYVLNLIFPCLLLYCVSILGFFLPVEGGQKINLEVTVLLALVVLLLMVSENMPPTPDAVPILGLLFGLTMIMVSIATVMGVVVTYFYFYPQLDSSLPRCAQMLVTFYHRPFQVCTATCDICCTRLCATRCSRRTSQPNSPNDAFHTASLTPSASLFITRSLTSFCRHNSHPSSVPQPYSIARKISRDTSVPSDLEMMETGSREAGTSGTGGGGGPERKSEMHMKKTSLDSLRCKREHDWKCVSRVLDRFFFWVFCFLTLAVFSYIGALSYPNYLKTLEFD